MYVSIYLSIYLCNHACMYVCMLYCTDIYIYILQWYIYIYIYLFIIRWCIPRYSHEYHFTTKYHHLSPTTRWTWTGPHQSMHFGAASTGRARQWRGQSWDPEKVWRSESSKLDYACNMWNIVKVYIWIIQLEWLIYIYTYMLTVKFQFESSSVG